MTIAGRISASSIRPYAIGCSGSTSPYQPGVTRRFSSFSDLVTENGMSRVYGGIHFLKAVEDGFLLGKGVGAEVERLLPPANR